MSPIELIITIIVGLTLFVVLWKYFRWALEAVIIFVVLLVGLYIALRILETQGMINFVDGFLAALKSAVNEFLDLFR